MASSGTVRNTRSARSTTACGATPERLEMPAISTPARPSASDRPLPTRPAPTKPTRGPAVALLTIRRVDALERAQQRRPLEEAVAGAGLLRVALQVRIGIALVV